MTTATLTLPRASAAARPEAGERALTGRGWKAYLVLAALLAPFVVPPGPAQLAILDLFNLAAIGFFLLIAMSRRPPIMLPFLVPVIVISVGSLLAITNAISVGASALSLAQDAYLYLWFVALVSVMSRHGDLYGFRLAWVLAANVVAVVCIVQAALAGAFPSQLLAADGFRPAGTFYGANMGADYIVLSIFVALSLWGRTSRLLVLGSLALLFVGLLTTKSNGSLISLVVGGGATALLWSMRAEASRTRNLGALILFAAVTVLAWGAFTQWGVGAALGRGVGQGTMLGRMEKSSDSRKEIWGQLGTQLVKHPLGIGPGNSVLQSVAIGHRVRAGTSFQSKEAHSDYMAYAIERGPIGLLGHLLWVFAGIGLVLGGDRAAPSTARPAERGTLRDPDRRAAMLRAVFVGGLIASAVHSLVIEKLHFRHYWMFLALSCAVSAGATFRSPSSATAQAPRLVVPRAEGAR